MVLIYANACARNGASGKKTDENASAERLANRLMSALGGERRLDRIRYFKIDITHQDRAGRMSSRKYWLDREQQLCRIEAVSARTGKPFAGLLDLKTNTGKVFTGYRYATTDDPALLREALAYQAADMTWVFGLKQLTEPGAQIKSLGTNKFIGQASPTLELTTTTPPGRRIYHLTSDGKGVLGSTTAVGNTVSNYLWTRWQPVMGFKFPVRFELNSGTGPSVIVIENLLTPGVIESEIFTRP